MADSERGARPRQPTEKSRARLGSSLSPAAKAMLIFAVLAAIRVLVLNPQPGTSSRSTETVTVRHVIDGDTFILTDDRRVRLLGVDAPEMAHEGHEAEPHAVESTTWLRDRIEGSSLRLTFDHRRTDKYGRLLAWVYLSGGRFINVELLAEGQARLLSEFGLPADLEPQLRKAEAEARVMQLGIWQKANKNSLRR